MVPTFWAPTRLASQAIPGPGWVKLRDEPFSPNRLGPSDPSGLTFRPKVGMLFCGRYLAPPAYAHARAAPASPTRAACYRTTHRSDGPAVPAMHGRHGGRASVDCVTTTLAPPSTRCTG